MDVVTDKKEKIKCLYIEIPKEIHTEIKKRAVFRGMTIKHWVLLAISQRIELEKKHE